MDVIKVSFYSSHISIIIIVIAKTKYNCNNSNMNIIIIMHLLSVNILSNSLRNQYQI